MQERIFYAAARAKLMAARLGQQHVERAIDRDQSQWSGRSSDWSNMRILANGTDHSPQVAMDRRYEMARARCAVQMIYEKGVFDESKHPRAAAGRPDGGQFVAADGATDGETEPSEKTPFWVPKSQAAHAALQKKIFDGLPNWTTTELTAKLHSYLREAEKPATTEQRAYDKLWADRIQKILKERDFSDHNAPLVVKERIWRAQQKYSELFYPRRKLEDWLAESKRTIWKPAKAVLSAQGELAAIKAQMQDLANVTGARLPENNPIRTWSFEQKFARAAEIALQSDDLAPEVAAQLKAAIEPANLVRSGAMMAGLALAHTHPLVGLAADTTLLALVGTEGAFSAYRIYLEIDSIQSETDLHAAAKVLEKEIASEAASKLIQLLTWGAAKGTAGFHRRFQIKLDHDKVRRLSNGSMPLSPNPANLVPVKVVARKGATSKSTGTKSRSRPRNLIPNWLKKLFKAGQDFDKQNRHRYPHNEVEVTVGGAKFRVDSLHPAKGEIVSRRLTQLGLVKVSTAIGYFSEFVRKYSPGTLITNSPFNHAHLRGKRLRGKMIFEVPVQKKAIPQAVKDAATDRAILIRDINGKVYNP